MNTAESTLFVWNLGRMVAGDVMFIVQNTVDVDLIDAESREVATLFVNMFISFSYPLNFIIYCCMSHHLLAT